jgi:predicted GNAT family acetyltransferase
MVNLFPNTDEVIQSLLAKQKAQAANLKCLERIHERVVEKNRKTRGKAADDEVKRAMRHKDVCAGKLANLEKAIAYIRAMREIEQTINCAMAA